MNASRRKCSAVTFEGVSLDMESPRLSSPDIRDGLAGPCGLGKTVATVALAYDAGTVQGSDDDAQTPIVVLAGQATVAGELADARDGDAERLGGLLGGQIAFGEPTFPTA